MPRVLPLLPGYPHAILAAALCAALAACDRAPLGTPGFRIELISPEASEVQVEPQVDVTLRVIGRMAVDSLTVAGRPSEFDRSSGIVRARINLRVGRNLLVIRGFGGEGTPTDTFELVHLPYEMARITASRLPEPRADATATPLADGRVLLAGGVTTGGQRLDNALLLTVSNVAVAVEETIPLQAPRAGHTATLLPDGRVLLLGGAASEPDGGNAEIVDPKALTSEPVTIDGNGFSRVHHVTRSLTLNGVAYLHAIGGTAPTEPSGTIDILRWRPESNTLETLSPPGGTGSLPLLQGAAATVTVPGIPARILLEGLPVGSSTSAYGLLFDPPGTQFPFSISEVDVGQPAEPRMHASFSPILDGVSLLAGGIDEAGSTKGSVEVATVTGFFQFPDETALHTNRSHHAATSLGDGRILIVGGQGATGAPLASFELFLPR